MQRCLDLALLGAGHTAPNPMVGAVLVYEGRIIGEGYHRKYGEAHAEVNCIASVKEVDHALVSQATLHVSLEPCAHYGKTPPCADLIIEKKIPRVVVGCRDPFPEVDGRGIERLKSAGVEVVMSELEAACKELNRRFFTYHTRHRPFIVLKWAQSADRKIASGRFIGGPISGAGHRRNVRGLSEGNPGQMPREMIGRRGMTGTSGERTHSGKGGEQERSGEGGIGERTLISNEYSNRLVHKWRSEEASILVGTQTALLDDPALTVRHWEGPNPVRLILDKELRLPQGLQVFDRQVKTIIFNLFRHEEGDNLVYYQVAEDSSLVHQVVMALHQMKIQSVLVEGGAALLQSFIDEGYWDEARVITNEELEIKEGLSAPVLKGEELVEKDQLLSDTIRYYANPMRP